MSWNQKLHKAIENYKKSIFRLAELIEQGATEHGRDRMVEATPFDEKKINWFVSIGRLPYRDESLLPEVNYEVVGEQTAKRWLRLAKKDGLKPSQLRKLIRATHRLFNKEKTVDVALWPKYSVLLENELKKLPVEDREKALIRIKEALKI